MKKRGISNIVATILLVLITIAGVVILWVGLEPMLMIEVINTDGRLKIVTSEGYTYYHENSNAASIQVGAEGKLNADYAQIILLLEDGNEVSSIHFAPEINSRKVYAFSLSDLPKPTHAAVAPAFIYEGRTVLGQRTQFQKIPELPKFDIYSRVILPPDINNVGNPDVDDYSSGSGSTSSPFVYFVSPTPENNYHSISDTVDIKVETNGLTDEVVFLDWENSMVAWWRMDERTSTKVIDSSNHGRNGQINTLTEFEPGMFGEAINCTTTNGIMNLGPSKSLFLDENTWTIALWFKADSIEAGLTSGRIITIHAPTGTPWRTGVSLLVGDLDKAIVRYDRKSVIDQQLVAGSISTGTWYFFGATYNGSQLTSYLNNGVSSVPFTNDFIDMSEVTPAFVCAYNTAAGARFDGLVDEVMIFNRALSASEMNSLYDATAYPYATTFDLSGNWPFNYKAYAIDSTGDYYSTERRVLFKV